ncbi:hypothetical protein KKD70_03295 [Patescibacteria group bacterium]|nr:hypothetical protein [Patescibacteria group bacterium]
MKTKIFQMNKKLYVIVSMIILSLTMTSASANFGSSVSTSGDCYGQNCVTWHNNGYTHTQYPYGIDFATFNGYSDAKKGTRKYDERQFMYIQTDLTSAGVPNPTPWDSWSNYNFNNGTSHTINFDNYPDKNVKVGFWGYMHNNGEADLWAAENTSIKLSGWSSAVPQTSYTPTFTISSSNTKPRNVWSNVQLNGSEAFSLEPTDLYVYREDDNFNLPDSYLQSITHEGLSMRSHGDNPSGKFASSELHYVLVFVQFTATPVEDQPGVCRDLQITRPSGANDGRGSSPYPTITTDGAGFDDEELQINVDADPGSVSGYIYTSSYSNSEVTFNNNTSGWILRNSYDGSQQNFSVALNGIPRAELTETITVTALDENGNQDPNCRDAFQVKSTPDTDKTCAELETDPGRNFSRDLALNEEIDINIETLLDTDGNIYTEDDGSPAIIKYCYSGDIEWRGDNWVPTSGNCVLALSSYTISVIPRENGTMSIEVVSDPTNCNDRFTLNEDEGVCRDLSINQNTFDNDPTYSATVQTDPNGMSYDVQWTVERDGRQVLVETTSDSEIDLNDYGYNFNAGDILKAEAININDPNNNCVDELNSEDEVCNYFELDKPSFERGYDEEICFDTDWDYVNRLEYETSDGKDGYITRIENDCFILESDVTEEADWVKIWIEDWEDDCIDQLVYEVNPPNFDKNVRNYGASYFSQSAIANFSDDYVEYEIKYTHYNPGVQDVEITDTIGRDGYIQGYLGSANGSYGEESGRIYYIDGSMIVTLDENEIQTCDYYIDEYGDTDNFDEMMNETVCYYGNIGDVNGITVRNVPDRQEIRVTYHGDIQSEVNPESCTDPNSPLNTSGICGEVYPNTARFEDDTDSGDDNAELTIPCPYIIIRAGGDVILENPFDYGVDTLSCADINNVDVPVVVVNNPTPNAIVSTGGEDTSAIPVFTDRICKESGAPGYEGVDNLSSLICEINLETSADLTQAAIVQNINTNKERISRYESNMAGIPIVGSESMLPESRNGVYYKNDGDLVFGNGSNVEFTKGAKTFIVEDHDVIIKNNIIYKDAENAIADPRNIASISIIVINGSIIIGDNVTETSGAFFVQEGKNSGSGMLCEELPSTFAKCDKTAKEGYNSKQYVHYGSIYGDIEHLFKYRTYAGDPTVDAGAVVIRFDNRIYLNTPPVLGELVSISQKTY